MRTTPLTLADTSPRRWWWWPGGVVLIANMLLRSTCVKAESVPLLTSCLPPDLATQFYWAGNVEFTVRLWMVDWRALSHPGFAFTILARAPRRLSTSLRHCTASVSEPKPHLGAPQIKATPAPLPFLSQPCDSRAENQQPQPSTPTSSTSNVTRLSTNRCT